MGKRYRVILFMLLVVGGIFNFGQTVQAENEISSYEVNYDANDGTGQMIGATANKGEAFTLPENGFTAPSGMQFKEWAIGSDNGDKVKAGGTYTFTGATTVYAVWETIPKEITTYAITYDANGGTGQMDEATATEGKAFTLPQNGFTAPSGMRFKEWAIGCKEGQKVNAEEEFSFTEATTIYAVWELIPVAIDATNFPDEAFRNYLLEQAFGEDAELTEEEMEKVTEINVIGKGVTSLTGIEYFQRLEQLSCQTNLNLTSLDVSKNDNLILLNCLTTGIDILDLSKNTNLQMLNCSFTKISSLDVSNNAKLETLTCFDTKISSLNVSKNTNLKKLNCSKTDISILDVSKNTKLEQLDCSKTNIENLDVSKNVDLQVLYCASTGISNIDVSKNAYLTLLHCTDTRISSLDVSKNTLLELLYCSSTKLSSLDVSNTRLNVFECTDSKTPVLLSSGNIIDLSQLSGFDASKASDLQNATLSDNKLTVADPSKVVSYTYECGKNKSATFNLEITSYEINYDANGGAGQMIGATVNKGELLTLPQNGFTAPSGMRFKEWAIGSKEGEKVKAEEEFSFTEATTIYAVWEPITYRIQFNKNDGTAVTEIQNGLVYDKEQKLDANPFTREGYTFKGWSDAEDGAVLYADEQSVKNLSAVDGAIVDLYAVWEQNSEEVTTYTITFNANGGTGQMAEATATEGKVFTLPQNGFTAPSSMRFKEWAIGSDNGDKVKAGKTYTFAGTTTVYAVWETIPEEITTYAITYYANGGTGQMAARTAIKGKEFTLPQNGFTAPSGKQFKEWALGSADGEKVAAGGTYTFTNATIVYAVWEPALITITYDANGGVGQMGEETAISEILFNLPQNGFTAPSGMQFKEWAIGSKEGQKVKAGEAYIFKEATTVYAVWEKIPETYAITFNANGGTGQMAEATVTEGKAFTLPQNSFTAPSGKRFKEWAVGRPGGIKVKAGGTYIFTGETTVYAVWEIVPEKVATYAITFNANGGTGQMAGATATEGKTFTLPQNSFTAPSGKRFKEWAVGSAGGTKVKAGGAYTFTGATTVYAVWEAIPTAVKDVKKATYKDLQLKAKASKTSNKLSWKRVNGADGYVVYGAKRGKKLTEIKASTKGVSFTHKKLSKKTFYQYQVKAYRLVNGEKKFISVSQNIYSVTTGGKYDNAKKLTVNISKLTLKKGKTKTIKAKLVGTNGKKLKNYTKAFRYETSDSKVASVSAKGKIRARKKGKCTIYVYAQNGLSKAIRVTVR